MFVRARIYLNYWPRYGMPDPKDLPDLLSPWSSFVDGTLENLGLTLLLCFALSILSVSFDHRAMRRAFFIPCAMWGASLILWVTDPFGMVDWFFD